jgi:hypothetical protein
VLCNSKNDAIDVNIWYNKVCGKKQMP